MKNLRLKTEIFTDVVDLNVSLEKDLSYFYYSLFFDRISFFHKMDRQAINIKFVPFTAYVFNYVCFIDSLLFFCSVEWKKVQSIFRSNNYDDLSQACNILNMWKFR